MTDILSARRVALVGCLCLPALVPDPCSGQPAAEAVPPPAGAAASPQDLGYALGFRIGERIRADHEALGIQIDYAAMARAFGGYGERVTKPEDIVPAIQRGIEQTKKGVPVLLEFITSKEVTISVPK